MAIKIKTPVLKGKIVFTANGYFIRIPKALIEYGIFEMGTIYDVTLEINEHYAYNKDK